MELFKGKDEYGDSLKILLEQLWEYQEAEANLMVEIATIHYENGDTNNTIGFLEKSVEIYHELGFDEQEATIQDLIGDVYRNIDNLSNALEHYYKSLKISSTLKIPLEAEVLAKIEECEVQQEKMDDKKVNKTFPMGLKVSEESSEPEESIDYIKLGKRLDDIIVLLDESAVYGTYQKYENPMFHLEEAYQMASSIDDKKGEAALLLIMGDVSLKAEKTKKALDFFHKSLNFFQRIGDKKGESIALLLMGTAYFLLGEVNEGSNHLRQSMDIIRGLNDPVLEKAALELLNSIYD
ncbi:tetratricopeptide repeat protein [Methanobacterium sp. BAmetb5]|uniref:tetratricopeptide repeat protein n=1 Tax=Methanobacterium sp. BAmetb5 TaxID=2025351 RepID=UPI000E86D918|nr:tetratricopeptide repeat protein [Methanobacterium sp. BAmetb5]AXV39213.1 MAG: hypothetical protein CIT02_02200 [Methanobacterium sp. BAmetb5]